jgi:hypothetical protein
MTTGPLILIVYAIWAYFFASPDDSLVLAPVAVSAATVSAMIEYLSWRDRQLPIFDVGALCALITLLYCAVPVVAFAKSGYAWSVLSDLRLQEINPGVTEVAGWAWNVTGYLVAFCLIYPITRGGGMPGPEVRIGTGVDDERALLFVLTACLIYAAAFSAYFDVDLQPTNKELASGQWMKDVPLLAAQTIHNVLGILRIAVVGLIAFAAARRDRKWLLILAAFTAFEAYSAGQVAGPRTDIVVILLCAILCWHRLIRPIRFGSAVTTVSLMLAAVLMFGYWRDVGPDVEGLSPWTARTEFQTIMANGLHVAWARAHDVFKEIPWEVTVNDLILPVPQQLLPFAKVDLANWYINHAGIDPRGTGLMFGVVAQSQLGFGSVELILRGAVLGLVLALVHRKCVRHADSLLALTIYLWLCVSIYYTFRASTFYIVTWGIYRVLPFVLAFWVARSLLRAIEGRRTARVEPAGAA